MTAHGRSGRKIGGRLEDNFLSSAAIGLDEGARVKTPSPETLSRKKLL